MAQRISREAGLRGCVFGEGNSSAGNLKIFWPVGGRKPPEQPLLNSAEDETKGQALPCIHRNLKERKSPYEVGA